MNWRNIKLWLDERFPLVNFVSGFFLYFLAKAIIELPSQLSTHQAFENWGFRDFVAMWIPAMHLFLLRVFDEHKDYETDRIHYPQRVVQRGLVTLPQIRILGGLAFALQIFCFVTLHPSGTSWFFFLVLWAWTTLMTKEFFVGEKLKAHIFIYGVLHLLVTPLLLLVLLSLCSDQFQMNQGIGIALALAILTGWLYELARKSKGPEEETGDLSYSKIWGARRTGITLLLSSVLTLFIVDAFFRALGLLHFAYLGVLLGLFILVVVSTVKFIRSPSVSARKSNEKVVALISAYAFVTPVLMVFL